MGHWGAIAVGLVAGLVGTVGGGAGMGLLAAILIGGMAWFAFAWNPTANSQARQPPPDTISNSNHEKPNRVFSINNVEYHQPKEFGYVSVKAAHDLAVATRKSWLADINPDNKLFTFLMARPSGLDLQLTAMFIAVHYLYATSILKVPQDVLTDIRSGISEAISSLVNSHQIAESVGDYLQSSIANYSQALLQEIANKPDPQALSSDCGSTSLTFIVLLGELYKDNNEYLSLVQQPAFFFDDHLLQELVADAWSNQFGFLQKNLRLRFIA